MASTRHIYDPLQNMTWLRTVRVSRGMSQRTLTRAAGVSQVAVSHLENGRTQPRYATACALADALGVEPHTIFPPDGAAKSPMDVLNFWIDRCDARTPS